MEEKTNIVLFTKSLKFLKLNANFELCQMRKITEIVVYFSCCMPIYLWVSSELHY